MVNILKAHASTLDTDACSYFIVSMYTFYVQHSIGAMINWTTISLHCYLLQTETYTEFIKVYERLQYVVTV